MEYKLPKSHSVVLRAPTSLTSLSSPPYTMTDPTEQRRAPPAPQQRANPTTGAARLNAAVEQIESLKSALEDQAEKTTELQAAHEKQRAELVKVLKVFVAESKRAKAEVELFKQRVDFLESMLGVVEGDAEAGDGDITVDDEEAATVTEEEKAKLLASISAVNSQVIKVSTIAARQVPHVPLKSR